MIAWPHRMGTAPRNALRRRGRPLRMLGLVLGGWVALRLIMLCLAVPAGAGVGAGGAPAWRADPGAMLAARPGRDGQDRSHAGVPAPVRRGLARHGSDARPAVPDAAPDILAVPTRMAGLGAVPHRLNTWHAGLLAVLDEDRVLPLRD